jgi:hypothetical protein
MNQVHSDISCKCIHFLTLEPYFHNITNNNSMKLTMATGIVAAQALPVMSEGSTTSNDSRIDFAGRLSKLKDELLVTTTKKKHQRQRTGTMDRTTVGTLFHHGRRRHRFGKLLLANRGPLPNRRNSFCDPSSQDADIGMLSCGLGYECKVDEASILGGVCVPSTTSRDLQENEYCYVCPMGFTIGKAYYDTIIEDTESGYGGKTCEDVIDPAYNSRTIDATRCASVTSAVQGAGCCRPICQLCDRGSRLVPDTYDTVVDGISLPGSDDAVTCLTLFDAGYNKATIDPEICPTSRQAAIESGCCVAYPCLTCDVESYFPPTGDVNDPTCYNLRPSELPYYNSTFSEDDCLAATQLAENEGCCNPRPIYNACNICGNATFYPENIVFRATCGYLQSIGTPIECTTYAAALETFCCGPAVPADDTEAPVPTPDESTGEPAADSAPTSPPSAASALWSSGPVVVSMMCLTSSTLLVGGWWLLELN